MKFWQSLIVAVICAWGLSISGAVMLVAMHSFEPASSADVKPLLDRPIAETLEDNVSVTTTATEIRGLSTVAAANSFDTVFISNSSTTCIRVGGSTVTSSRGAIIGSGCYDGPSINIDGKRVWLISESGTVSNVRLVFGVRQ